MALMQLTMIPVGSSVSVGKYVTNIQRYLEQENATFQLNDMGTLIEGDIKYLLSLLGQIYEIPFKEGALRVVTNITIDDRRDKKIKIGDKVRSVTRKLKKDRIKP